MSVEFELAGVGDDAEIQRLLRENPTRGAISISLERAPDYFRSVRLPETEDQTIIAREKGCIICMGRCSIRSRYVNGTPRRVGYLSELRLDHTANGRFDVLRRGYRFFEELQRQKPADAYFTSIAADNERSRRVLERGLRGMPRYEFVGDYRTLFVRVRRTSAATETATHADVPAIREHLNVTNAHRQFSAHWCDQELMALSSWNLPPESFQLLRSHGGQVTGCAAVWDQRPFRQVVIRGYSAALRVFRRLLRLPKAHSVLAQAALVPFSEHLIRRCMADAHTRGIRFLTMGFHAADSGLQLARRWFHGREYRTRLYQVTWPGIATEKLNGLPVAPDFAFL